MRTKRQIPFKGKPRFAIVIDGETEFWYLQMIKRNERQIKVDIKPEIPQKKKLSDQYSKVLELSKSYDKVYWIIDLDVILSESLLVKKGNIKAIDALNQYKAVIENKHKNVIVVINQPCLEFWFLIHFELTAQQFSNCEEAGKKLKKHLTDYTKTEKYFTKQDNDIYLKLKPFLKTAIANSKTLSAFDNENLSKGVSEMFKLFEDMGLS
ncbi:MAG: RloB family protein [Spirosomataceae bacterium]